MPNGLHKECDMTLGGHEANCVIDLERLKFLHCGFGQFSLCLGTTLLPEAKAAGLNPVVLTMRHCRTLLPEHSDFLAAEWWRKTESMPWLKWMPRPGEQHVSLWHATHQFTKFWPSDLRTPVLLTIHDLNFLREDPPLKVERMLKAVQWKVDRAAAVAVISNYVREEIREYLNLGDKPVRVIYNGADREHPIEPVKPQFRARRPFLFSLGSFAPRKNFHTLIGMMEHLPEMDLVVAGELTTPYGQYVAELVKERGLSDRVILPGIVGDGERQWLYENCAALVFPSLTEGFGLPVVEAMGVGRPVILSSKTSLPEIGGPDAFFWKDFEPQPMAAKVRECLSVFKADRRFASRLKTYAAQYTWAEAARQYVSWYAEIVGATASKKTRTVAA